MSSMRLKEKQIKSKGKINSKSKFKHRKIEQHKNNKKVARRGGHPGEANVRSKNPKPKSRNKSTETTK